MDPSSLSKLKKLKENLKKESETEAENDMILDPSIFFSQIPGKQEVEEYIPLQQNDEEISEIEDDIFGSSFSSPVQRDSFEEKQVFTEDDLFGGQSVEIQPSFNVEEEEKQEQNLIDDIQKKLQETKLSNPSDEKAKIALEEGGAGYINGSMIIDPKKEDKPAVILKKARKSIKKSQLAEKEVENVAEYELLLIKLLLNKLK
ncbi:MAG: hypothetical protein ACRCXZ_07490 [Patescibacteria group bacterium]